MALIKLDLETGRVTGFMGDPRKYLSIFGGDKTRQDPTMAKPKGDKCS